MIAPINECLTCNIDIPLYDDFCASCQENENDRERSPKPKAPLDEQLRLAIAMKEGRR